MATKSRKRNVSRVWNPSLGATLSNPKKGRKTVANKARKRRRNAAPASAAAHKPTTRANPKRRKRGARRRNTAIAKRTRRNPASRRSRSLMKLRNPASGASLSVSGVLGTVVLLGLANNLINRFTTNQGPVASAGIKIGAGFGLIKFGKKIPLVKNYSQLAGLVLVILGGQDLFNQYASPYLANLPLVGQAFAPMSALPPAPADAGVGRLVNFDPNAMNGGMGNLVNFDPNAIGAVQDFYGRPIA